MISWYQFVVLSPPQLNGRLISYAADSLFLSSGRIFVFQFQSNSRIFGIIFGTPIRWEQQSWFILMFERCEHFCFIDDRSHIRYFDTVHEISHIAFNTWNKFKWLRITWTGNLLCKSILGGTDKYENFIRNFLEKMFPSGDVPLWTVEALQCAGLTIKSTLLQGTGTGTEIELEMGTGEKKGRLDSSADAGIGIPSDQ